MRGLAALAAIATLAAAWLLPWDRWTAPFPAHMIRHMTLVAIAAPLIVLALPRLTEWLAIPALAGMLVEFAIVWSFHLPGLHNLSAFGTAWFVLEQAAFLLAGLAVWAGALAARPLAGAGAMLLTSMHMTLLGALIVLSPRPMYLICGQDLGSQQLGGLIMLGIGTPVYLVAGLWLVGRALHHLDTQEAQA
ncbi:cytochrome c oxidase assembly protein [Paracoccus beibuensis]|uniref:cytochrome c oxidase assembly protein n=1 Tax=Paracoccus beibuensis TaxID=547602 RepID=UPI00223EC14B|nr:cytochrome c oxidase assembly protein [Paracoccus beibuensis]